MVLLYNYLMYLVVYCFRGAFDSNATILAEKEPEALEETAAEQPAQRQLSKSQQRKLRRLQEEKERKAQRLQVCSCCMCSTCVMSFPSLAPTQLERTRGHVMAPRPADTPATICASVHRYCVTCHSTSSSQRSCSCCSLWPLGVKKRPSGRH